MVFSLFTMDKEVADQDSQDEGGDVTIEAQHHQELSSCGEE